MAQDLNKGFEKEKPEIAKDSSPEGVGIEVEKIDRDRELLIEKEPLDFEKIGEEAQPLEKTGEALQPSKKAVVGMTTPEIERQKQIDEILAEGLNDVFLSMTPKQQKEFQEEGQKTVTKINKLLNHTKVKIKNIINLITKWLRLIPKVNKYFLEQEAKIKADKIMKLKK